MKSIIKAAFLIFSATGSFFLAVNDSSALPVFARQMGVACEVCHEGSYPLLTAFGRSFKASGYTMTGAQEKIEGDKLSIPAVENLGILFSTNYEKTNGQNPAGPGDGSKTTNDGALSIPEEVTLFFGGRAGENVGFLGEAHFTDTPNSNSGAILGGAKLPIVFKFGESGNILLVPFSDSGNGVAYSFETLNTGAVAVHTYMADNAPVYSAAQYLGTAVDASGFAVVGVNNDLGFINFAKWSPNHLAAGATNPTASYLRLALTPANLIPDWDPAIGVQIFRGSSLFALNQTSPSATNLSWEAGGVTAVEGYQLANGLTPYPNNLTVETRAWIMDGQLQGTVGGNILAFYASYGVAAASDCSSMSGTPNLFNPGCSDKKSFNIGTLYEAIPHLLFLEAGYRNARTSDPTTSTWYTTQLGGTSANTTVKDNAWEIGGFLKPTQNSKISLTYAKFSGSLYDPTSGPFSDVSGTFTAPLGYPNATAANGGGNGDSLFEIEGNIDF